MELLELELVMVRQFLSSTFRMVQLMLRPFGTGSGPLNYSGQSPLHMVEHGRSDPCLGMAWADTDNPVY